MLTTQQLQTLKVAIEADPVLAVLPKNDDTAWAIADAFNLPSDPAFIAWRTSVPVEEIMSNGFVWTEVDALNVGQARIWEWMTRLGVLNPSRTNIRAGIDNAFKGVGAGPVAMRAGVYSHCKRNVTRAEKLFAVGTGTDATPATMVWEGMLTYQEIRQAREQ